MKTHDIRIFLAGLIWWGACLLTLYLGPGPALTIIAILATIPAVGYIVCRYTPVGRYFRYWAPTLVALLGVGVMSMLVTSWYVDNRHEYATELIDQHATVTITGTVSGYPSISNQVYREIAVETITGRGKRLDTSLTVRAIGDENLADLDLHAPVTLRGRLSPADQPSRISAWVNVSEIQAGELSGMIRLVASHRSALHSKLPDGPGAGLVPGLGIGDDSRLPVESGDALQQSNLTHLTAVSGAHISMICAVILGIIGGKRPKLSALACALVLGLLYIATGGAPSVTRASLMGLVTLVGLLLSRPASALPALGLAIIAMLLVDPGYANDYGFVLSVTATATILLAGPPATEALRPMLGNIGAHMCAIPIVAHLGCAPIIATLNPEASMWSALANLLCAPMIPAGTIVSLLALIAAPVGGLGEILIWLASWLVSWIDIVARFCYTLPGAHMSPWAVVLIYLLLIGLGLLMGYGFVQWKHVGLFAAVTGVIWLLPTRVPEWDVVQCDVGQGHATLIRDGEVTYLIDTGSPGTRLDECLTNAGASVDVLILTHAHDDHIGQTDWVVATFQPEIWAGPGVAEVIDFPVHTLYTGDQAGVMDVLWPDGTSTCYDSACTNNQSLVIRFGLKRDILIAGDIEKDVQCRLADRGIHADIVLIPHHGSPSACAAFADSVAAPIALLGVGENTFGHPNPDTIAMYAKHGTVLSTLDDGDLYLSFDMEY